MLTGNMEEIVNNEIDNQNDTTMDLTGSRDSK